MNKFHSKLARVKTINYLIFYAIPFMFFFCFTFLRFCSMSVCVDYLFGVFICNLLNGVGFDCPTTNNNENHKEKTKMVYYPIPSFAAYKSPNFYQLLLLHN